MRKQVLAQLNIECGAGLSPLAGRIWRGGLMGGSSPSQLILLFLAASATVQHQQRHPTPFRFGHGRGNLDARNPIGARCPHAHSS